jgi:signal transduction protein with GAF and PtsI domain
MATTDHLTELKKLVSEMGRKPAGEEGVRLDSALQLISQRYGVQPHEIAVLCLASDDERFLRFLAPENLRAVGRIPLSSGSALAARTVREKRPEIVNHFVSVSHASVFEGVPTTDAQRTDPIQKIMSCPILHANKAIGVLQVSRKGKSAAEAGADFSFTELRELKAIADALSPTILLCMKENA